MPKAKSPMRWYEVTTVGSEVVHDTYIEVPNQPYYATVSEARKWLLGSKDAPGNAPGSGKYLLLRQLDEQDLVVQTVRTVMKAADLPAEATKDEDAGDNPWESDESNNPDGDLL